MTDLPSGPMKLIEMLQNVHNLTPEELMKLENARHSDPSKFKAFPAGKVQKCFKRVLGASDMNGLNLRDIEAIQNWCSEDFYMESMFRAGGIPVFIHVIAPLFSISNIQVLQHNNKSHQFILHSNPKTPH
mmetsp:Transcript_8899/g.14309  ORF Transcript_8899/g.14309 Transcript_8899/m.14309 type:complete len:130 (+) Transcript_8899:153-542(+)